MRRNIDRGYLIEVGVDDALAFAFAFACNAVEIDDAIVMHDCSRALRAREHDAGYRVFCTDLSEFQKAGGSAKCLTLKLEDGPALVASAVSA